jgi:hypothetical protein
MILFRGDTKSKGAKLVINENTIDYSKNKAGFFYFTNSLEEAKEYATDAMNEDLRANHGLPNITTVSVENVNLLDFSKVEVSAFNAIAVFDFLNNNLFSGKMNADDFEKLSGLDGTYFDSMVKREDVYWSLRAVHIANELNGMFLKELLIKNNFDGFIFKDTSPSKGLHFGFVSSEKINIVSNEIIN